MDEYFIEELAKYIAIASINKATKEKEDRGAREVKHV